MTLRVQRGEEFAREAEKKCKERYSVVFFEGIGEFLEEMLKGKLVVSEAERRERIIRLLQCRAGGRPICFEAGMMYQMLLDLGMKKFETRVEVYALEEVTCHYGSEEDAKEKLRELLGESR